jgi:hypothetical protein
LWGNSSSGSQPGSRSSSPSKMGISLPAFPSLPSVPDLMAVRAALVVCVCV